MALSTPPGPEIVLLAIDPGRDKCGVAVVNGTGCILLHRIWPRSEMSTVLPNLAQEYQITHIVLGHATSSHQLQTELQAWLPQFPVTVIDETGSTLEARALYWEANPPQGWRRCVPLSLQTPLEPVDDFAAVVLARRYLNRKA